MNAFERRVPGADDVQIDILYCGVCHSDLHTARNEWNNTLYPSVPGHEIIGRMTAVGANVQKFKDRRSGRCRLYGRQQPGLHPQHRRRATTRRKTP